MRRAIQRGLTVMVLVAWTAPGVAALGVGLHLADHDGHHGGERHGHADDRHADDRPVHHGHAHHHGGCPAHDHDGSGTPISDLLQAALHGHHHGVGTAPDHHHDAIPGSTAPVVRPLPAPLAALPDGCAVPLIPRPPRRCDGARGTGPPAPLFHTHCALLL